MTIVDIVMPVIVLAISVCALQRLRRTCLPAQPAAATANVGSGVGTAMPELKLRAGVIEYILVAVVVIGTIGVGFAAFGKEAETAFKKLGTWVQTSTQNLSGTTTTTTTSTTSTN